MKIRVARDGIAEADGKLEDVLELVLILGSQVDRLIIGVVDGKAGAVWALQKKEESTKE